MLQDAYAGTLKPLYNFMADLPDMSSQPMPILPAQHVRRTAGTMSSVDLGRGCPYQCSFCTIINVQGRKSRFRSADDLEAVIRENCAQNINRFFITDDNFARNRNWEAFFDRLIRLREEQGFDIKFTIQVDTLCHQIPNFIEKAARAGVARVFIGLENINPDSLLGAKKRQNRITDYRAMLQAWKKQRRASPTPATSWASPTTRKETIKRDIEIIKRELPVDILEFFILTPLPGSEDHKVLHGKGAWMDPDMNKYDLNHRVVHHPTMSDAEWEDAYWSAWEWFYSPEHMETIMRRAAACGLSVGQGHVHDAVVLLLDPLRPRASAGERLLPPEVPPRPAPDHAARERARVLSALCLGDGAQPLLDGLLDPQDEPRAPAHQGRRRAQAVHRPCRCRAGGRRVRRALAVHRDARRPGCGRQEAAGSGRARRGARRSGPAGAGESGGAAGLRGAELSQAAEAPMALPLKERLITLLMPSALYYRRRIADEAAWGEHELDVLDEIVQPGGTPIDVGANQGFFAFAFSRIVDRVEAFEPNPDYAAFARRMLGTRAHVHEVALSNANGTAEFVVPVSEEGTVLHLGGYLAAGRGPEYARAMRFEVEVRTLDSYAFGDVRVIKVDVEGSEMDVLEGGRETILRDRPPLIVELLTGAHPDPVALTETICATYGYAAWLVTKDRARVEALPVMRASAATPPGDRRSATATCCFSRGLRRRKPALAFCRA